MKGKLQWQRRREKRGTILENEIKWHSDKDMEIKWQKDEYEPDDSV